jgi:carbon-monoxide dehydrogenase medium subunit
VRNFEFLEPSSPEEASRMLADAGENSRLFAGGTALMLAMRQRMLTPSHVIYLGGLQGYDRIEFDERQGLRIGMLVRHADVAGSPVVRSRYPMLAEMAANVANPRVRNQGTLGGNLCYGDPATDPPGCLIALGARLRVVGSGGERRIELAEFFTDYYQTALGADEVLTHIEVPPPPPEASGAYIRHLRTAAEHRPLVSVAFAARRQGAVFRDPRIVIGAATAVPTRVTGAAQYLEGKTINDETLNAVAELAASEAQTLSDLRSTAEYRTEVIRVVVRRAIAKAYGQ